MKYDKILPARLQWKAVAPVHRIRNADMRAWLFGLPLPPFVGCSLNKIKRSEKGLMTRPLSGYAPAAAFHLLSLTDNLRKYCKMHRFAPIFLWMLFCGHVPYR